MQHPEPPAVQARPLEIRLQAVLECHRIASIQHGSAGRIKRAIEHDAHAEAIAEALVVIRKKAPKPPPGKPNRPNDLEEAKAYAREISLLESEAVKFFDHFLSNGWKVGGKAPMKDWHAAMRTWKSRNPESVIANGKTNGTEPDVWRDFLKSKSYPYVRLSEAKGWMRTEFTAWRGVKNV